MSSTAGIFTVAYSTISGNGSAASNGNGITAPYAGTLYSKGSIVAGNFSRYGVFDLAGTFHLSECVVQSPGSATITVASSGNHFGLDPQLSALADHGAETLTMLPAAGSPAVDAIADCTFALPTDQRGLPRCSNGAADIGAVERQSPEDIIFRNGFNSS